MKWPLVTTDAHVQGTRDEKGMKPAIVLVGFFACSEREKQRDGMHGSGTRPAHQKWTVGAKASADGLLHLLLPAVPSCPCLWRRTDSGPAFLLHDISFLTFPSLYSNSFHAIFFVPFPSSLAQGQDNPQGIARMHQVECLVHFFQWQVVCHKLVDH